MDIKKLLLVGVGKTGNVIVNDMMNLDSKYTGLYINTAKKDMINLENFNDNNYYKIPQVDGTGRNREKARDYLIEKKDSFIDIILEYDDFSTICYAFSMDGGTGSGCTPSLMNMTKAMFKQTYDKDVKIIAVAILPKTNVGDNGINNTKECWNDLLKLKNNGVIDTLYLVDNNKRDTYEEINEELTKSLHLAFTFDKYDMVGELDTNDSTNINLANGYNLILTLEDGEDSEEKAIVDAQERSVFVLPTDGNYYSNYSGLLIKEDTYDIENISTILGVAKYDTYKAYTDEDVNSILFFGGLEIPKGAIDVLDTILKSRETKETTQSLNDLLVNVNREDGNSKKSTNKSKEKNMNKSKAVKKIRSMPDNDLFKF